MEVEKKGRGKPIFAVLIIGALLYKISVPFMEETKRMKGESKKLVEEIKKLKVDADVYDDRWDKKLKENEEQLAIELPDVMNSALVLDYFLSQFEKRHPAKVRFVSVNHQLAASSDIKHKVGKDRVSPRLSRYKIKAHLMQDTVVDYLEHIEKFTGLFGTEGFSLVVSKDTAIAPFLEMEIVVGFYLMPKQWVPESKLLAEADVPELREGEEQNWFQIFNSNKSPVQREVATQKIAEQFPKFKIEQLMSDGIVVLEQLYEEGDTVQGWKILKIDKPGKSVFFKKGSLTRRMVIP